MADRKAAAGRLVLVAGFAVWLAACGGTDPSENQAASVETAPAPIPGEEAGLEEVTTPVAADSAGADQAPLADPMAPEPAAR